MKEIRRSLKVFKTSQAQIYKYINNTDKDIAWFAIWQNIKCCFYRRYFLKVSHYQVKQTSRVQVSQPDLGVWKVPVWQAKSERKADSSFSIVQLPLSVSLNIKTQICTFEKSSVKKERILLYFIVYSQARRKRIPYLLENALGPVARNLVALSIG